MIEREVDRFRAKSADGQAFIVVEHERFTEHRDLSGKTSINQHTPRFCLRDGSSVNRIDAETFEIVQTQQIIRKVR